MFADLLNQTVSWAAKTAAGESGPTRGTPVNIAARKERRVRKVTDQYGNEVVSTTTIFTESAVQPDDTIDGVVVIDVMTMVDGDGTVEGYEALL